MTIEIDKTQYYILWKQNLRQAVPMLTSTRNKSLQEENGKEWKRYREKMKILVYTALELSVDQDG